MDPGAQADGIWFGCAIAPVGDLDGDGAGDFLASAPRESIRKPEGAQPRPSIRAISGARGRVLTVATGGADFGSSIAVLGDLDGDGKAEFASGSSTTEVWVCSGADGSIVRTLESPLPLLARPSSSHSAVASPGDLDGDGAGDLIVSWYAHQIDEVRGKLRLYSGSTGEELYRVEGADGAAIERLFGLPDLNGDRVGDWAHTAPLAGFNDPAIVTCRSGKDGAELFAIVPQRPTRSRALALAPIGDLTGDGIAELALGASELAGTVILDEGQSSWEAAGEVQIVSGRDGSRVRLHSETNASPMYGRAVAGGADLDGDGVPDYVVTEHEDRGRRVERGRICVYSGADHRLVREIYGSTWEDLGASLALLGDVDRDGVSDLAVGCMHDYVGSYNPGRVLVVSGKTGKQLYYVPP